MIRKGLVLSQIPILWKVKCPGEKKEMVSHLDGIWSFYLNSIFCNSFGNGVWSFFSFFHHFFREDNSILLCWYDIKFLWRFGMVRPFGMSGHTVEILVCDCGGIASGGGGCQYPE